jgi:hypothetical protein
MQFASTAQDESTAVGPVPARGLLVRLWAPGVRIALLAGVITFLVVFAASASRVTTEFVSPYDEGYHLSYVEYAFGGTVPRVGDQLSRWGEDAYACHLVPPYGVVAAVPCGVDGPSSAYPERGLNTAAGWPPTYYFVVAALMRPVLWLTDAEPLTAARLVSAGIWAFGAGLLGGLAGWRSRAVGQGAAIGIVCGTAPTTYALASYVTPHAAALAVGSTALAGTLWAVRTAGPAWRSATVLAAVGAASTMIIPQAIAAILVLACTLVAYAALGRERIGQLSVAAAAMVGSAGLAFFAWRRWVQATRLEGVSIPTAQERYSEAARLANTDEGPVAALRDNWDVFWLPFADAGRFHSSLEGVFIALTGALLMVATGYALLQRADRFTRSLAVGLVVGVPTAGFLSAMLLDFAVPARYGATLVPLFCWLLAVPGARRWYTAGIAGLALSTTLLMLSTDFISA